MGWLANLDLISVGVVVSATAVLGFSVYFQDRKSVTSRAFLSFSLITACWGAFTYAEYHVTSGTGLWLLRLSLFCAVWQAYSLLHLFRVFPSRTYTFHRAHVFILFPIVATTSIVTLTPFVLDKITSLNPDGTIASISNGAAMPLFGLVAVALIVYGLTIFLRKTFAAKGVVRRPYKEMLYGTLLTFALIISFSFLFPAFLGISKYVPLGSLFIFPFIAFTAHAIMREHLFNIKVVTTSSLVFVLSLVSLGEILFSDTLPLVIFHSSVFALVLIFGINLIRGVFREVRQREELEELTKELTETNERQETLIHFIGHEVKGFLTKAEGTFAAMVEGDLGEMPETMKTFAERALAETRDGVTSVSDILKASNLKKGTTEFKKEPFDLKSLLVEVAERARPAAEAKGLAFALTIADGEYTMTGDRGEVGDHVLRNLIDNAVNYTPSGSVTLSLARSGAHYVFSVQDTGVGITAEDKARLFTEGGHGKDSQRVNVNSTGYGLFIAKHVVEAHGGTIRAESAGAGAGSTFSVELPA